MKVVLSGIEKAFGPTPVLRGVSLAIDEGEFLTLLGPSGCGKSTLLRIIAGLEHQDRGSVAIGGRAVDDLRPKQRDVAMVFQSYALYPHMTVFQNMAVPLRMRRLSAWQRLPLMGRFLPGTGATERMIADEVTQLAETIGIGKLLQRKPGQLSGGQRQRVAVGRAMVRHPSIFLMDEPLSNLDAKLRVTMRAEIKELHRRLGVTFIYVTHDQAEAMTLSDRVAVMLDGELLQVAPPAAIYADPVDRRVAEFIGSPKINMLPGAVVDGGHVRVGGASLAVETGLASGSDVSLGVRPEALRPAERGEAGALVGSVHLLEHLGADLMLHVRVPGVPEPVIVRLPPRARPALASDVAIALAEPPLVFDAAGVRVRRVGQELPSLRSLA